MKDEQHREIASDRGVDRAARAAFPDQPHTLSSTPPSGEDRGDYDLARKTHRIHIITALLILAYTTITAVQAFLLWATYRETRRAFVASEEPYVSLGNRNGRVAEFRRSADGSIAIVIYFFNAGRTPALNFVTNLWSSLPGITHEHERHIERFRDPNGGVIQNMPGPVMAGEASHRAYLPPRWTPKPEDFKAIQTGKQFSIGGTFEYCDQFGNYRCEGFWARYRPPPINDFVQFAAPPCWLPPSTPPVAKVIGQKVQMIAIPRCERISK